MGLCVSERTENYKRMVSKLVALDSLFLWLKNNNTLR